MRSTYILLVIIAVSAVVMSEWWAMWFVLGMLAVEAIQALVDWDIKRKYNLVPTYRENKS